MPDFVQNWMTDFEKSFGEIKASRKLEWLHNAGAVELELERNQKESLVLRVSPRQASLIMLFTERGMIFV